METIVAEQTMSKTKDVGAERIAVDAPEISIFLPVLNEEPNLR